MSVDTVGATPKSGLGLFQSLLCKAKAIFRQQPETPLLKGILYTLREKLWFGILITD